MTQAEIIKGAIEVAKEHDHKAIVAATSDGNFFLITAKSDLNACFNHARTLRNGSGEPLVYIIDCRENPPTDSTVPLSQLLAIAFDKGEAEGNDSADGEGVNDITALLNKALSSDKESLLKLVENGIAELTNAQLKSVAEAFAIDLGKASKKADIIEVITAFTATKEDKNPDADIEAAKQDAVNLALSGDLSKLKIAEVALDTLDLEVIKQIALAKNIEITEESDKAALIDAINAITE